MKKILLTYFTKTNTTKEICEYIAKKINQEKYEVSILPIDQVKELSPYDFVIAGSPIHGMQLAQEMQNFIKVHEDEINLTNFAFFYDSYILDNGRKMWQKAIHNSLDQIKIRLSPFAIGEFYGRVEKPFGRLPRLLLGNHLEQPLDRRDWSIIDDFTNDILAKINQ